jgi:hypothetical protein
MTKINSLNGFRTGLLYQGRKIIPPPENYALRVSKGIGVRHYKGQFQPLPFSFFKKLEV